MNKLIKILSIVVILFIAAAIGANQYAIYNITSQTEKTLSAVLVPGLAADGLKLTYSKVEGKGLANDPIITIRDAKLYNAGAAGVFGIVIGDVKAVQDKVDKSRFELRANGPLYIEEAGTNKTEIILSAPLVLEANLTGAGFQELKKLALKLPDFFEIGAPDAAQSARMRISYDQNPQVILYRDGIGGERFTARISSVKISNLATNTVIFKIIRTSVDINKSLDKDNPALQTIKTESVWDGMSFTAYLEVPLLQRLLTRPAKFENNNTIVVDRTDPAAPKLKSAKIENLTFSREGFLFEVSADLAMADGDPMPVGTAQVLMSNPDTIIADLKATGHVKKEDAQLFSDAMFVLSSYGYIDEDKNLNFLMKREAGKTIFVGDKPIEEVFAAVEKVLEPALKEVPAQQEVKPEATESKPEEVPAQNQ